MVELVELFVAAGLFVGSAWQPAAARLAASKQILKYIFILFADLSAL
jgi:hypothetical protein